MRLITYCLKNFNLHHSFWSDLFRSTQHVAIDQLLNMMNQHNLSLILLRDIVTWKTRNIFNIIDLTFAFNYLADRIKHCMIKSNMNQSSNHISIFTRILLEIDSNLVRFVKRRAWKLLDINKLRKIEKEIFFLRQSRSAAEVDVYIEKIQSFLQKIIDAIVSWTIFSRYVKFFWNKNCDEITKKTRRLRRIWFATDDQKNWKNYMQLNDRKQKIIQKVKRFNFCQKIKKVIDIFTNLWRLARWAKNKSQSLKEILKILALKFND
jgi:hypothetical protein